MNKEELFIHLKTNNYWWSGTPVKDEDKGISREYIGNIERGFELDRIVCISGIRRSGKTTISYQYIDHLIKKGIDPERIVHVKVDLVSRYIDDLRQIISAYTELTGVDPRTEEVHLILDEVQTMEDWQVQVKEFIDMRMKLKTIVLGSSVTLMYLNASESLAGRITFINVKPLSFREFLTFEGLLIPQTDDMVSLYNILLTDRERILYHFNEYVKAGGFPEWFRVKDTERWYRVLFDEYLNLILMKDIVRVFKVKDPRLLENLVREIALLSCERFSYKGLADRLDADRETLKLYLYYLRSAGLVHVMQIYSKKKISRERTEKKIAFFDEGMRRALTLDFESLRFTETLVNAHLISIGKGSTHLFEPYYWKNDCEVDFIYDDGKHLVPVEVKYRKDPTDTKGIVEFMEDLDCKRGIVVTKDLFGSDDVGLSRTVDYVPLWFFLLCDGKMLGLL
ncbi:MAG: ATP-binding protein [Candidatus Thermoplasmatota archaeon]|nr:ATP-binding protein [Candidatus Thermoplasmatota archaeon]